MVNSDVDMVNLLLYSYAFISLQTFFSNIVWRGKSEFIVNAKMVNEDTLNSAPLPKELKLP